MTKYSAYAKINNRKVIITKNNMNKKYFIDQQTLEKFVEPIIAQKYPDISGSELASLREESIQKLDDSIGNSIFGSMTEPQLAEFSSILDKDDDPEVLCDFFDRTNINLEEKITEALEKFKADFLGGDNA